MSSYAQYLEDKMNFKNLFKSRGSIDIKYFSIVNSPHIGNHFKNLLRKNMYNL